MLHVPSALPKFSRRRALFSAAALALLGATTAGCGQPPPSPDLAELAAQLERARADSKLAAEAAGTLRAQSPQLRGLTVVAAERTAHAQALSDELIAELFAADTIVIGAPMYNFSIPTTLRAWFDHVLRPRVTFAYSEAGPQGLVTGKKVIVIESRGGLYSEGPAQVMDFQEPYLRALLGFIGLTDVEFIHAEKIGFGPEARDAALAGAKARIAEVTAGSLAQAA